MAANTYRSTRRERALSAVRAIKAAIAELEQVLLEQPTKPATRRPPPAPPRRTKQASRASSAPAAAAVPPCERHRFGFGPCTCPPAVRA